MALMPPSYAPNQRPVSVQSSDIDDESIGCHVLFNPHAFRERVPLDLELVGPIHYLGHWGQRRCGRSQARWRRIRQHGLATRKYWPWIRVFLENPSHESRVFGWWENLVFDRFVWLYMFLEASIFRERETDGLKGDFEIWEWTFLLVSCEFIFIFIFIFFIHLKFSHETNKDYLYNWFVILII